MKIETTTGVGTSIVTFRCPVKECKGKEFKSAPALRMHTVRIHGPGWDTSANFRNKNRTREELLAKKRDYNKKTRAENIAKGLTGSGKPRKRAYRPKPKFGSKWSPERLRKFKATWEAKKANGVKVEAKKNSDHLEDPRDYINNCPGCGKKLQAFYLAAGIEKRQRHG